MWMRNLTQIISSELQNAVQHFSQCSSVLIPYFALLIPFYLSTLLSLESNKSCFNILKNRTFSGMKFKFQVSLTMYTLVSSKSQNFL